ncbi:hypothetical protein HCJ57_15775 [Listeria booriae]|uniref:hypothetical protein n=1 Tax=Listeria booriae TaxID=1552123 RepID=UPI0016234BA4|nr:hypothetical protein [Listeria booriae]MBC2057985.1 hypothetical protein [Listeria booriae]
MDFYDMWIGKFKTIFVKVQNKITRNKPKHLSNKGVMFPYIMAVITVLFVISVATCTFLFGTPFQAKDTGTGSENQVRLAGTSMFIVQKTIDEKTHRAEVLYQINRASLYQKQPLFALAAEQKNEIELPSKLVSISDDYVLLVIDDIPDNWRELVIDVGEYKVDDSQDDRVDTDYLLTKETKKTKKKEDDSFVKGVFNIAQKKMPDTKNLEALSDKQYILKYATLQIKSANGRIAKWEKDIVSMKEQIGDFTKQIQRLEKDKGLNTTKENQEMEADVTSVQRAIEKKERSIESRKEAIAEVQEKIKKLEEKIDSLE